VAAESSPEILWMTNAHRYKVEAVSFSLDAESLASCSLDRTASVWWATNGSLRRTFQSERRRTLVRGAFTRWESGRAGDGDGKTAVWQVSDGTRLWIGGPDNRVVYSVTFSADTSFLAIGRTDGINVRYVATGIGIPFGEPAGQSSE